MKHQIQTLATCTATFCLCLSYSPSTLARITFNRDTPISSLSTARNTNYKARNLYPLLAQSIPSVPRGTIEPTQPQPPLPSKTLPSPNPKLRRQPKPPEVGEPSSVIGTKVRVNKIQVRGSTVFSPQDFDRITAPFVNKTLTFEQLLAVRTTITNFYTSKGYTTSGAFLPPQNLANGVLRVQVVEGELERIEIKGLNHLRNSYVRARLAAAVKTPVNLQRLESALQLLQQSPLLKQVEAELTKGTAPGRSVLILNLKEASPFTAGLSVDNKEPPSVGSFGSTALLSHNNLLGFGDRLSAEFGITQGVTDYSFGYEIPLNSQDGRLSFRYSNGRNRVIEQPFKPLDINGRSQTYSIGFRQPLVRTPNQEFAIGLSADLRQSRTYLFEDKLYSFTTGPEKGESRVSAIRFSTDWVSRKQNAILAARSQFSLGLGILGATVNDTGTDGRFFSWLGQVQWLKALNQEKDAVFIARAATQLTGDSLLPLEQFSIGGVDSVRGYRTSQKVGDNGAIASVELRVPIVRDAGGFGLLQLTPFFDAGIAWSNQNDSNDSNDGNTLLSAGLGLRWQLNKSFAARLDWGIPLVSVERRGNSLQDDGLSFSVQWEPILF